ncbi:MAG: hypothetical protein WDO68_11740 [Gammaproteobacteria bacterium]
MTSLRIAEASTGEHSLGDVVLYESDGVGVRLEVHLEKDTVWLTQAQMAELFQRDQSVVSRHMKNVFEEGELDEATNMQKMHTTPSGRPTVLYSPMWSFPSVTASNHNKEPNSASGPRES